MRAVGQGGRRRRSVRICVWARWEIRLVVPAVCFWNGWSTNMPSLLQASSFPGELLWMPRRTAVHEHPNCQRDLSDSTAPLRSML